MRRLVSVLVPCLVACGPGVSLEASPGDLGARTDAIVGGQLVTTGDDNVFMLVIEGNNGQSSICTATLIESRTLATAAHCVDPRTLRATRVTITATNAPSIAQVRPGFNTWNVTDTRFHPGWDPNQLSDDIGLALLERAPNVTIKPWNQQNLAPYLGRTVRAIGYGTTGPQDMSNNPQKRVVSLPMRDLTTNRFYLGNFVSQGICHGDSGGPSFFTFPDGVERLVGIHSFTTAEACTNGADVRVDAYIDFINQWMREKTVPQCTADSQCATGCTTPDPDCVPEFAGACQADNQCAGRTCISDPQNPVAYCSRECSATKPCPTGTDCEPTAKICRYIQRPERDVGEACEASVHFCRGGSRCAGPTPALANCVRPCTSNTECQAPATCAAASDGQKYCLEPVKPLVYLARVSEVSAPAAGCTFAPTSLALLALVTAQLRRRRRA